MGEIVGMLGIIGVVEGRNGRLLIKIKKSNEKLF